MATAEQIKNAISVLTASPEQAAQIIDEEIQSLRSEIRQLLQARRLLSKTGRPGPPVAKVSAKLNHWNEVEAKVFALLSKRPGENLLPSDIAKALGLNAIQVGKAVSGSKRLEKRGPYVSLIVDDE